MESDRLIYMNHRKSFSRLMIVAFSFFLLLVNGVLGTILIIQSRNDLRQQLRCDSFELVDRKRGCYVYGLSSGELVGNAKTGVPRRSVGNYRVRHAGSRCRRCFVRQCRKRSCLVQIVVRQLLLLRTAGLTKDRNTLSVSGTVF